MSKMVKLVDLCIKITDGSHYSPQGINKGYPMFSSKDMQDFDFDFSQCKYISANDYKKMVESDCKPLVNDVLIIKDGNSYLQKVFVIREERECAILSSIGVLRPDISKLNPYYLKYYLSSEFVKKEVAKKYVTGSALPRIILKNFGNIEIPYIDLCLQEKAVSILKLIDLKIENNNKINSELESMAKTIYDYWFLQFDFPDENGKPYKSSGGKMVWNEELKREIPAGWTIKKIQDILASIPITKKYKSDEYGKGNKYPIIDQSLKYICGYTDNENDLLNLESCIVFGDHTKHVKYVNFAFARGADGTQIINSSINNVPNYILYRQILSMDLVSQGYSRYFKFLKDKYVIVPHEKVSDNFMKSINDSLNKMKHIISENKELEDLRDFLLPLLMNGQVGFKEQ